MKKFSIFLSVALVGAALLWNMGTAHAQGVPGNSITITPAQLDITLGRNDAEKKATITVINTYNIPIGLDVALEGIDSSSGRVIPGDTFDENLAKHLKLSASTLTIQDQSSSLLDITIANAETLSPGGHYATLIFTQKSDTSKDVALKQQTSVSLFVVKEGGHIRLVEATDFKISGWPLLLPSSASFEIKNSGNVHAVPRASVIVYDGDKQLAKGLANADSRRLLPGNQTVEKVDINSITRSWFPKKLKVVLAYRADGIEEQQFIEKTIWHIQYYWFLLVVLILVVFFLIIRRVIRSKARRTNLENFGLLENESQGEILHQNLKKVRRKNPLLQLRTKHKKRILVSVMTGTMRGLKHIAIFLAMTLLLIVLSTSHSKAAINEQINFQGKLTNTDGTNVTNGTYSIVFSLYTVSSGGSNIWTETQSSVTVTDGIFRVSLGSVTSLSAVDFNGASLYLGITVGADPEMTPRVRFTASPYAFNSNRLGGVASTGFLQIGPSAVQADSSTNSSIFLNKTAAGNLIQLQSSAVDIFNVSATGDILFGQNAAHTIGIAQELTNAAGNNLTMSAGQGGPGAGANAGGVLAIQGGAGGGTNGAGGNLTLASGAGSGSGAAGSVIVKNPANTATGFQIQNATSALMFVADTTNSRIYVGDPTSDANGILLVLDSKTGATPTGANGGMYYNATDNVYMCYRAINATAAQGVWEVCGTKPVERAYEVYDEFMSGTTASGGIGEKGWTSSNITGAPAYTYNNATPAVTANRPGILRLRTTATTNNGGTMQLTGLAGTGSMALGAGQIVRFAPAVSAVGATTTVIRIGLHNETTTTTAPTTGVWFEHNPASSANWRYCYNNAGAVCADSGVAVAANTFNSLEIRINSIGALSSDIDFFVDGVRFNVTGVTANTTNLVSPAMTCYTLANTARDCFIDYYQLTRMTSARR